MHTTLGLSFVVSQVQSGRLKSPGQFNYTGDCCTCIVVSAAHMYVWAWAVLQCVVLSYCAFACCLSKFNRDHVVLLLCSMAACRGYGPPPPGMFGGPLRQPPMGGHPGGFVPPHMDGPPVPPGMGPPGMLGPGGPGMVPPGMPGQPILLPHA